MCGKRESGTREKEVASEKVSGGLWYLRGFHNIYQFSRRTRSEHLPLHKPWYHAIETKLGFQLKKSKVYALSPTSRRGSG